MDSDLLVSHRAMHRRTPFEGCVRCTSDPVGTVAAYRHATTGHLRPPEGDGPIRWLAGVILIVLLATVGPTLDGLTPVVLQVAEVLTPIGGVSLVAGFAGSYVALSRNREGWAFVSAISGIAAFLIIT